MSEKKTAIIALCRENKSATIDLDHDDAETVSAKLAEFFNGCAQGEEFRISIYAPKLSTPEEVHALARELAEVYDMGPYQIHYR